MFYIYCHVVISYILHTIVFFLYLYFRAVTDHITQLSAEYNLFLRFNYIFKEKGFWYMCMYH